MSDKDYAPLSASCVRALSDKLYEKRKVAALEIERMVKDFSALNNTTQIQKLLKVLGQDFAVSQNPHTRKGGLIGLAATAIALGKESGLYVNELVRPVLACFHDQDSRVRYYACESLYNIVKVARGAVLPFFNDIFDGLSKLAADPDQNVRSGSELLDRLMKDIVTESSTFDLAAFLPLLRERVYTKSPFARQFIVSWVSVLDAVPDIDMLVLLPDILDGLFQILGDQNLEIRKMCESVLGEFLRGITNNPQKAHFSNMVNILILHSQSTDDVIQFTAITWLKEFVALSGRTMLPFASGILTAVLPCLSYDGELKKKYSLSNLDMGNRGSNIREAGKAVNSNLIRLVDVDDDDPDLPTKSSSSSSSAAAEQKILNVKQNDLSKNSQNKEEGKTEDNEPNISETKEFKETPPEGATQPITSVVSLDVSAMVEVLTRQLLHDSMQTRIASLRWILHLHIKTPNKMFKHVEELFPLLLKTLSDPSDEVVLLDLDVLAEISSSSAGQRHAQQNNELLALPSPIKRAVESSHSMNGYFSKFMLSLLKLFSTDRHLLEDRGSFIIRQLCLLLSAEDIYRCSSEILLHEEDMKFASHMIQTLSTILLTSTELFELRSHLKDLRTEESCMLFCCLYKSWCHSPVATVSLCFLTQNYKHACHLLQLFGDLEVTVDFLTEIDKLVQLIESPIFTYLRLQLLDVEHNQHLIKSLYGLLMLLPQSDAFRTLRHRLDCVPKFSISPADDSSLRNFPESRPTLQKINFTELTDHFKKIQDKHRTDRRQPRTIDSLYFRE